MCYKGYEAYERSQGGNQGQGGQGYQGNGQGHQGSGGGDFGVQGSAALNSYDNNRPSGGMDLDHDAAVQHAASQSGGNSDMFSSAMSFLQQGGSNGNLHQNQGQDLDENELQQAHQQAYGNQDSSNMSSQALGSAAAMNALKQFTQGGGQQQGGGNMQSSMISQGEGTPSRC